MSVSTDAGTADAEGQATAWTSRGFQLNASAGEVDGRRRYLAAR
jgi:hypothetical protein